MKRFRHALTLMLALLSGSASAAKPNVLLLLTDDQRADTIAALGNPAIHTPNLDALARRGTAFSNAYSLGSNVGAVCQPSRNMLLSGRAYFRWAGSDGAPAEWPNLPVVMKSAGYETFHQGKRGNNAPQILKQFDHNHYIDEDAARRSGEHGREVCDDAIAFLKRRVHDKPFFMYLAFEGPHDPRVAAEHYRSRYDEAKVPLPANFLPIHPFDNGWMTGRDERLEAWPRTRSAIRRHLHDYYACITSIDSHIGRLFAALDELGLTDDTVIVFSSDNGLAIGSHGLMGKQNVYDAGLKVPLIVAGPGVPRGRSSDALVYLHDLFPTLCELVGAPLPDDLDGKSLVPILSGRHALIRDSLFLSFQDSQRAVRDAQWKLIRYPQIDKTQLFDLTADPHESRDLAAVPSNAKRIDLMLALMKRWQKELGDDQPLTVENPKDPSWMPPAGGN